MSRGVDRLGVGKEDPAYKRFIISTCQQKKRPVRSKHGKIHQIWMCYTNPFHVRRNMSRFWSFPLISFWPNPAMSPLTNGLTPHEVQRQKRRGWNYLFITPVEPHLLTELFHSPPGPVEECRAQHAGPWLRESCFSCFVLKGSSVSTAAGALHRGAAECCLTHKFGYAGPIKKERGGGKEAKFTEFRGIICAAQLGHLYW